MGFEDMTPEQQEKARACKTMDEVRAMADEEGHVVSDETLEGISVGIPCFRLMRCPKAVDTSGRKCQSYAFM